MSISSIPAFWCLMETMEESPSLISASSKPTMRHSYESRPGSASTQYSLSSVPEFWLLNLAFHRSLDPYLTHSNFPVAHSPLLSFTSVQKLMITPTILDFNVWRRQWRSLHRSAQYDDISASFWSFEEVFYPNNIKSLHYLLYRWPSADQFF